MGKKTTKVNFKLHCTIKQSKTCFLYNHCLAPALMILTCLQLQLVFSCCNYSHNIPTKTRQPHFVNSVCGIVNINNPIQNLHK